MGESKILKEKKSWKNDQKRGERGRTKRKIINKHEGNTGR